jgi:hypothetical protein
MSLLDGSWVAVWLLHFCWPSPAQWFLVSSSRGLVIISCCLTALEAFKAWKLQRFERSQSQSQSQSYFTTGGLRPISSSWRQAPWDSWPETFQIQIKSQSYFTVVVYRQSVHLGRKPLEIHDFFFNWTLAVIALRNILSDEKMGLSLMNMLGLFSSVRIAHIACYWKFFLVHYIQVLCQSRLCIADHAYLSILRYNGRLITWNGPKFDHRQI